MDNKDKVKKKKGRKLTTQCVAIVLICFALGLFVGNTYNYQDLFVNILPNQSNRVHVVHSTSEMAERGARVVLYGLGDQENDDYDISFNDMPQGKNKIYNVEGSFKNTSNKHFTTVELNFSLLDKNGNKIGDAYAQCDGLNTGQTWKFYATNNKPIEISAVAVKVILDDVIITML